MDLSVSAIASGLLFSGLGLWLFRQVKPRSNLKLIPIAIGLMSFSYFTTGPLLDWGLGVLLCLAAYMVWE